MGDGVVGVGSDRLARLAGRRAVALAALAVLIVVLALEAFLLLRPRGLPHVSTADRNLARTFAVAVTSFDYHRLDADVKRVLDLGTPGFEREFTTAMGADFTKRVADNKTVSSGDVVAGPQVQRVGDGRATFLVVLDQTVTSEGAQTGPQLVRVGLLVTVQEKDTKVASVQVL